MDCPNVEKNAASCACSYEACERRGKCCECLQYHLSKQQLPGCCFPPDVEQTYDRSFQRFAQLYA
jgi:hypothetical protein